MLKATAYAGSVLLGIVILITVWGVVIEPRLIEQREWTIELPGLPPPWNGRQIALMADLQVGMWLNNTDTIRRIVKRLVKRRPAAVLIAGDFIYHPIEDEPEDVSEEFEPSDYREDALEEVRRVVDLLRPLTEAGFRCTRFSVIMITAWKPNPPWHCPGLPIWWQPRFRRSMFGS
jgi:uncharacterized protein